MNYHCIIIEFKLNSSGSVTKTQVKKLEINLNNENLNLRKILTILWKKPKNNIFLIMAII